MKKVAILPFDDLDNELTADEEVQLGLDGQIVALDLTKAHADELRAFLRRYLNAGQPILAMDEEPQRIRGGTPQRRAYLLAFRNWCAERGVELEKVPGGGYKYPKPMVKEFDAALARGEVGPDGRKIAT